MLLLETKEAWQCLDNVLKLGCADEIHIGLNDLRISTGKKFIFEPVADGTVESIFEIINLTVFRAASAASVCRARGFC
mgnify:CR=1 FL=1